VTVTEVNRRPTLSPIGPQTVDEGSLLTLVAVASDPDLPSNLFTFSLGPGAPTNATIDSATGVFAWTPTEAQGGGSHSISVRLADNGAPPLSDTNTFSVIVNEVNNPPVFTQIPP